MAEFENLYSVKTQYFVFLENKGRNGKTRWTLVSSSAELVAIYGRRRIGKTFLIRTVYEKYLQFEFTGVHNASMQEQLEGFSLALKKAIESPVDIAVPKSWAAAFHLLENFLTPLIAKQKAVIFLDEFPWIHTQNPISLLLLNISGIAGHPDILILQ